MSSQLYAVAIAVLACSASACAPDRLQIVELAPNTLIRELLAHWSFDDQAGSVATDDSTNGHNGQLTGGTWLTDGRFAGALRLGQNEFVSVPSFPEITSSFTVSAWVRLTQYAQTPGDEWTTVVSTEASGGWEINVDRLNPAPQLHFGFYTGPTTADYVAHSCAGVQIGTWTQIAGTVEVSSSSSLSTFSVFLDGEQCFSTTTERKILSGSNTLTIGEIPRGGRYLASDVDDIAVWSRALVPAEINLLSRSPPTGPVSM